MTPYYADALATLMLGDVLERTQRRLLWP